MIHFQPIQNEPKQTPTMQRRQKTDIIEVYRAEKPRGTSQNDLKQQDSVTDPKGQEAEAEPTEAVVVETTSEAEKTLEELQLEAKREIQAYKELVQEMQHQRQEAAEQLEKDLRDARKRNVQSMLTRAQMLNSRMYTRESFSKMNTNMKEAARILANSSASAKELEEALMLLRTGIAGLEIAEETESRGRFEQSQLSELYGALKQQSPTMETVATPQAAPMTPIPTVHTSV